MHEIGRFSGIFRLTETASISAEDIVQLYFTSASLETNVRSNANRSAMAWLRVGLNEFVCYDSVLSKGPSDPRWGVRMGNILNWYSYCEGSGV